MTDTPNAIDQVTDPDAGKPELQAQAAALGLPTSGTKADLATRIDNKVTGIAERAQSVTTDDYTVGTWKGQPNYECKRCSFASLKKRSTIIHIASVHGSEKG